MMILRLAYPRTRMAGRDLSHAVKRRRSLYGSRSVWSCWSK